MIVAGCREKLVAAAEHVLPHQLHRHVCVTRFGEVAIGGASNEAAIALRIEPASCFSIGDDWCSWCAVTLSLVPSSASTSARSVFLSALSAASALIASTSSVVSVALALAVGIALALLTAATA